MLNLSNHKQLYIKDGFLQEKLSSTTDIEKGQNCWDLKQIASIMTVSSVQDAQARNAALEDARRKNAMKGAVAGGFLDAAMGEGDSLLDGVLLGAAFGYISSKNTEKPTASISLLFIDGEYLSLQVSQEEYTMLQGAASAARLKPSEPERKSLSYRPLSKASCDTVLNLRASESGIANGLPLIIAGAGAAFLSMMAQTFFSIISPEQAPLMKTLMNVGFYVMLTGSFLITAVGFFKTALPPKPQNFLKNQAEKKYKEKSFRYQGHLKEQKRK